MTRTANRLTAAAPGTSGPPDAAPEASGSAAASREPARTVDHLQVGDVSVTRVLEYYGPADLTPADFFPGIPAHTWQGEEASWLRPDFLDGATGVVRSAVQTWLLRSEGRTILIDTGVGNHKERPYSPVWSRRNTGYLDRLAAAGVTPQDVDVVVNTHLHVDHVGWNTRLEGRDWVPTFPNAVYLMARDDFDFWNPANERRSVLGRGNQNVFEDSVAPVHRAGQALLWEGSHRIDAHLRLDLAPGHTPGSSVVTLESGTDRAVFVGDLMHSPAQVLMPDCNSCFCEDPAAARATRRRLLGWAADHRALLFPAHFGGPGALEVTRTASAFAVKGWAPLSRATHQDMTGEGR
ncbi:MBL fold metallo-hydrolase [Streptomyces aureocirculatus]|uniref:MBL fold metallo-hydrolase n=1 Tax=Streptomyces aureocirculatus TaxID=67275 RepID=UPI00099B4B4F|nr:MBL fold metallo-hydrolase [Streptomyces aureocirculatus]